MARDICKKLFNSKILFKITDKIFGQKYELLQEDIIKGYQEVVKKFLQEFLPWRIKHVIINNQNIDKLINN